ncbi:MAG: GTPase ObgE [Planctomycetes bacterium]|nr:GTPase ObgE [Planctomycetota bacterium]
MFHDEADVLVEAGRGGDGCLSFRRERYVPKGGPDGGDGGAGGSVVFVADPATGSLRHLRQNVHIRADKGRPGEGRNCTGRGGEDRVVCVPCGTIVRDRDTGLVVRDLVAAGDRVVVARGGRPGRGNRHFATATNRTPRRFTRGQPGEKRWLRLELKLIADIGLVGYPNAGKSTFLARVSAARPKVADYPFTTLAPYLGLIELADHRTLVVADVPGLVAGAHEGRGLGRRFLRHLERTRALLFLIDPTDGDAAEVYRVLDAELAHCDSGLAARPRVVAATKADLWGERDHAAELGTRIGSNVLALSSVTGRGVRELVARLAALVLELR